jgi:hypothetical protein
VSTAVNGCTAAKAWTPATAYLCSASTTAAHSSATTTAAAVMALRVSAARKDKR